MSNTTIGKIVIIVVTFLAVIVLVLTDFGNITREHVYDCNMAEWHPDIPPEVKNECRRLRYEQWQREEQNLRKAPIRV